jgi:hypothetical protein
MCYRQSISDEPGPLDAPVVPILSYADRYERAMRFEESISSRPSNPD